MEEFNAAMEAGTSDAVKLWMNWMTVVFLASILFIWKRVQARWVFAALIATGIGAFVVWTTTTNVHLLGIVHLIVWLPLAIYLWRSTLSDPMREDMRKYRLFFPWICLLIATIVISLIFDVRDIFLVLTGVK